MLMDSQTKTADIVFEKRIRPLIGQALEVTERSCSSDSSRKVFKSASPMR